MIITVFTGFAANGKYLAPSGVTIIFKANAKSFTDTASHWAKNDIGFVTERELFTGTGNNLFSPDAGMTRAMFATVIGRLYERSYGAIAASSNHAFTDCDYNAYYGNYVDWAAKEGIISGYGNGAFGPNDQITREQMATVLYRFADYISVLPSKTSTVLSYPDAGAISNWSKNAASYCQSAGIITGRDGGNFVPQGTATRAEVAVILERFIINVLSKSHHSGIRPLSKAAIFLHIREDGCFYCGSVPLAPQNSANAQFAARCRLQSQSYNMKICIPNLKIISWDILQFMIAMSLIANIPYSRG